MKYCPNNLKNSARKITYLHNFWCLEKEVLSISLNYPIQSQILLALKPGPILAYLTAGSTFLVCANIT